MELVVGTLLPGKTFDLERRTGTGTKNATKTQKRLDIYTYKKIYLKTKLN